MFRNIARATAVAASLATISTAQEMVYPDTIVVLDVSNSMWGQIDGIAKISIAREVIGELVADLETDSEFGLMAYGHRRKSDCSDIELIIPVGPLNADEFTNAVNGLSPRGRTPLTDAVRQAAQLLNIEERSGRIILVSDGLESCDADPCALARELAAGGLDFATHVIGFDVAGIEDQSQLSCLADITGGLYLTAESTGELKAALETMIMADVPVDVPGPMITLLAVDENGSPISNPAIVWNIDHVASGDNWLTNSVGASVTVEYQADNYVARAALGARTGTLPFTFDGAENATFEVVLGYNASVDAPDSVEPLSGFAVNWTGPDGTGDYIALALVGQPMTTFSSYARTSAGSPVMLEAPMQGGIFEVRYISAMEGKVLATDTITVLDISIELEVQKEVEAGTGFNVSWEGPSQSDDTIVMIPLDGNLSDKVADARVSDGIPATLTAPAEAGIYQVIYLDSAGNIRDTKEITVFYDVTLNATPVAVAGATIEVTWDGPDNRNDYITIVELGTDEGVYGNYTYTRDGTPLDIQTVDATGSYELRYVTGASNTTIARLPITLTEPDVALLAPPVAVAGAMIDVAWVGPDNQNDYVTIVAVGADEGDYGNYAYTRNGSPAEIKTIDSEGAYELRYVSGQSNTTLARLPIHLTGPEVSLEAMPVAVAGSTIDVTWVGPDNQNDYITIVEVGADEGDYGNYAYTRNGSPAEIKTIDSEGAYELRYVSGQSKETLASLPITLTAPEVALLAEPVAVAGAMIDVVWMGPDNQNDYITIVEVGADEGEYGNYAYTRNGSPAEVKSIDRAGNFEVRYVSGQSKETLASLPLSLTAPEVALLAQPVAVAGSEVVVTWVGPDNQNDFITIVPVGSDEGTSGQYAYSRRGNPAEVKTDDTGGAYEIRYVSGQSKTTLATLPITLTEPVVTLSAEGTALADDSISVTWTGPDNHNDYITIVPVGADEGVYENYTQTRRGNPVEIKTPEEPGAYEIRYSSGNSRRTFASLPLNVVAE